MEAQRHLTIAIMATTFLFALHDATMKYLSAYFPVPLIVWARYAVQLIIMAIVFMPSIGREIFVTDRPGLMVFRALMQVTNALFVQFALKYMPLAETTALLFLTPMLVAALSGVSLGEKQGTYGWVCIVAGFIGVLLIARPGGSINATGLIYASAATLCNAAYQLITRKLSASEPPIRQLFYLTLVGTISMSFLVPGNGLETPPSAVHAVLFIIAALSVAIGHFIFIYSARHTPVGKLSSLLYIKLIWAIILGMLIFRQTPDILSVAGMLIIGMSGLSLLTYQPPATVENTLVSPDSTERRG